MKENIKISVIIPAYNEEKYILVCLKSLAQQTFRNFEVIIVDNGSTDKTLSLVKNFRQIRKLKIIQEKSKCIGKIRQVGFEKAQGEILVSTDADAKFPKNWLANINDYLKNHPETVAVGGPYSFFDEGSPIRILRKIITPFFLFLDNLLSGWKHHFAACNFAVRRDAFFKIGGFHKNLTFGEDIDLSFRLRKIGKVDFVDSIFILTSARRYKKNLPKAVVYYFFHYLKTVFHTKTR